MRLRFSKLNWTYGLGELVIVIAGVLIALAVDQWNSDRKDRLEEAEIVARLVSDLTSDLAELEYQFRSLERKEASLLRVRSILATADRPLQDPIEFLRDVVVGADYGWNQEQARRTTFDELLGAGKFALIRDTRLRVKIADYYKYDTVHHQRIDERETDYPYISYQLVQRTNEGYGAGDVDVAALELDSANLEQIIDDVFSSSLTNYVTAELNLSRFIHNLGRNMQNRCTDLLDELEKYQERIK